MNDLMPVLLIVLWVIVILLVGMVTMLMLGGRRQSSEQGKQLATMQSDMRALCNAAVQVGERMNRLEQGLRSLQQRQQELGTRQDQLDKAEPEARTFEQAVKMVRKGASVDELVDICGLSRGEAELIAMMNRLDKTD